jgi:uncharacterized FlgJ-related protein
MNKRALAFLQKMEEVKKAKSIKQKQKSVVVELKPKITQQSTPTQELRTYFPYTCEDCDGYICYDTLFINDMTGKYIALDRDTLRPHRCRKKKLEE